jgi:probable addiction module antidote protein
MKTGSRLRTAKEKSRTLDRAAKKFFKDPRNNSRAESRALQKASLKSWKGYSHDKAMLRRLRKDRTFAAEYLRAALKDEDEPRVLLIALRRLAQAHGIAKVAKASGVKRERLYRELSASGNPPLSILHAVAKAVGLKLTVEAA